MIPFTELFAYIALSHLLFMAGMLWWERSKIEKPVGVPIFFALSVGGYLMIDAPFWEAFPVLNLVFHVLPFLAPLAFWLFCKWIFDDHFRWQQWWWGLAAAVLALFYTVFLLEKFQWLAMPSGLRMIFGLLTQLVSLTFVFFGIAEALHNREADLVWSRFQFRKVFVVCTAVLMAMTALAEISLAGNPPPPALQLAQRVSIAALVLVFAAFSLSLRHGFFREKLTTPEPQPETDEIAPLEVDERLLENLENVMHNTEFWRTEGLTIRQLAEHLNLKEYRLRQVINQYLGYRNFNDYLHSFRINKACELLSDPIQRDMTVLEIAYQVGYASLAPFNKAFRELTGMSPTEWRRRNLS
ncbi:MAG: helix-turn-helix transcriptional regulator [Saprospiraceae bacterium]|jgi:AraC-like DNA-binding protein|nr:helix-turn-helix transcriptional regulator [Saprospiraceae bacterium]